MTEKFIDRCQEWATIILKKEKEKAKKIEIRMQCEFVIKCDDSSSPSTIIDVPSIALWSSQVDELGYISIGGPIRPPQKLEDGREGLTDLELSLYYQALRSYEPKGRLKAHHYSVMEYMNGDITWQSEGDGTQFILNLVLRNKLLGHLQELHFKSSSLFQGLFQPFVPRSILFSASSQPEEPADDPNELLLIKPKTLRMRFIAVETSNNRLPEDLNPWVDRWLLGVKKVWGQKAYICLDINREFLAIDKRPNIVGKFCKDSPMHEKNFSTIVADVVEGNAALSAICDSLEWLDVYLVTELAKSHNGGVKPPPDDIRPDAFILLQVKDTNAENYKYLLAHELGHVFGLEHPDYKEIPSTCWRGAYGSIMTPGVPNPDINPRSNIQILKPPIANHLRAILKHGEATGDCQDSKWAPDPEPWYIWVTNQVRHPDYSDLNFKEYHCYLGGSFIQPDKDHQPKLNPNLAYVYVRLSDLQLQYGPVTVNLYLVNGEGCQVQTYQPQLPSLAAKLPVQPRLDIKRGDLYLTFRYQKPTQKVIEDFLKRAEQISGSLNLDNEVVNIRNELGRCQKTHCMEWKNIPAGEYTLFAVLVYPSENEKKYPIEPTPNEIDLINALKQNDSNTLKELIGKPNRQCYGDYVQSVPINRT